MQSQSREPEQASVFSGTQGRGRIGVDTAFPHPPHAIKPPRKW